jgi:hypothetical protein
MAEQLQTPDVMLSKDWTTLMNGKLTCKLYVCKRKSPKFQWLGDF